MATEYDITDKIDRSTAELLRDSEDAIIAWGDTDVFVLAELEDADE